MSRPEHIPRIIETAEQHPRQERYADEAAQTTPEKQKIIETRSEKQKNVEQARTEVLKEAIESHETLHDDEQYNAKKPEQHTTHHYSRKNSFEHTMASTRTDLSPPERTFSRIIHNPTVEKISDFTGATILRPDAILSGSVCAIILVGVLYWLARYYGFALQGFETIGAFIIGWVIGIAFDIVRSLVFKRR